MKKQAYNPYLPGWEYIPDAEPHIFDGRVYIYGSHDKFNGISFCLNDYVSWSAPVDDLSDWQYEGVIFRRRQDPDGKGGFWNAMYAPDVCRGPDGRYYLYYFIGYRGLISVAVCDTPAGKYEYLGHVKYADGTLLGKKGEPLQFDPGAFVDDDGRIYLYTGFGPVNYPAILLGGHKASEHGAMGFELEPDMLTVRSGPQYIGVKGRAEGAGTPYEGHEFFEASSMRKFGGKYYFIYSAFDGHELCYAVSDDPLSGFEFGGTLVSNGDVGMPGVTKERPKNDLGNTHGSLIEIGGKYYVFYHRHTNRHAFSRQACAEEITFAGGRFLQAEMTSCGLNGGPLAAKGKYPDRIACNLYSEGGMHFCGVLKYGKGKYPYFTQSGRDREENDDQYIANFCDGCVAAYKYFDLKGSAGIEIELRGPGGGRLEAGVHPGEPIASAEVPRGSGVRRVRIPAALPDGKQALYLRYRGKGRVELISFTLL